MSRKIGQDQDHEGISRILNLPAPASDNEPARRIDLNAGLEGVNWKDNVRVVAPANVNLAAPGANVDGIAMVAGDRFLARVQTTGPENGVYIWNGAASAATRSLDASTSDELENAIVVVDEGTSAGTTWRQSLVNFVLGTGSPTFVSFLATSPAASETVSGILELATQAETDTGTDDLRAVTPLKLTTWVGRIQKFTGTIGDGAATQFDAAHNKNTRNVQVTVYRNASPWDNIGEGIDIERPDANTVRFRFSSAPSLNQFAVIIWA